MPNLSCARPVLILACVPASTSGLTRSATRAVRPMPSASADSIASLLGAFDVDLRDVLGQRQTQFARGFADAGEHDAIGRDAGLARTAQFAFADHIGARAFGGRTRRSTASWSFAFTA